MKKESPTTGWRGRSRREAGERDRAAATRACRRSSSALAGRARAAIRREKGGRWRV
jgi:hypothetical protein